MYLTYNNVMQGIDHYLLRGGGASMDIQCVHSFSKCMKPCILFIVRSVHRYTCHEQNQFTASLVPQIISLNHILCLC